MVFIYDGSQVNKLTECVSTLKKFSDCKIKLYCRTVFDLPIEHCRLGQKWNGRRMTHRMEIIRNLPAKEDDNVISCDIDVRFQGDPFVVFENQFDLFYTSRQYDCDSPVNAGVWGIRKNKPADALLDFMISQATKPTWEPYLTVRRRLKRDDRANEIDWWTNQDILCAFHESPKIGKVFDAGARYNCCPHTGPELPLTEETISNFRLKIGNPDYTIIHYKELEGKL